MNSRKKTSLWLGIAMLWSFNISCTEQREKFIFYRERATVERNTPPFNSAYFDDTTNQHAAVFFEVVNDSLRFSNPHPQVRPGHMPYHPAKSAPFTIIYNDAGGSELGRYAIEDPRSCRSCESIAGPPAHLKNIKNGTIELLLPYDKRIKSVTLYPTPEDSIMFPNDTLHANIIW
jgi:hypothetical protein